MTGYILIAIGGFILGYRAGIDIISFLAMFTVYCGALLIKHTGKKADLPEN